MSAKTENTAGENGPANGKNENTNPNVPKTGDNSPMVVLFLIASASCLVLLNRYKKSVN